MNQTLERLFISKDNYSQFLKLVEKKLSDETKLQDVLEDIQEKIVDGIKDLNIQENDQMNILTIVVPSPYFYPQNVFVSDVYLVKKEDGEVVVKY